MTEKTDITVGDCLKGAFSALLRGDTKERDRLCDMALMGFDGKNEPVPLDKSIFTKHGENN